MQMKVINESKEDNKSIKNQVTNLKLIKAIFA